MVTASANRTARIWDARTGEPIGKKLQHDDPVLTATFDASGERVVTASADKTARIWDATGSESSSVGLRSRDTRSKGTGPAGSP